METHCLHVMPTSFLPSTQEGSASRLPTLASLSGYGNLQVKENGSRSCACAPTGALRLGKCADLGESLRDPPAQPFNC